MLLFELTQQNIFVNLGAKFFWNPITIAHLVHMEKAEL